MVLISSVVGGFYDDCIWVYVVCTSSSTVCLTTVVTRIVVVKHGLLVYRYIVGGLGQV